jgi:hypothetical protein
MGRKSYTTDSERRKNMFGRSGATKAFAVVVVVVALVPYAASTGAKIPPRTARKASSAASRQGRGFDDEALAIERFVKNPTITNGGDATLAPSSAESALTATPAAVPPPVALPPASTAQPSIHVTSPLTNASMIPLCSVDRNGYFIPINDPRREDPGVVTRTSSATTFAQVQATQDTLTSAIGAISGIAGPAGDLTDGVFTVLVGGDTKIFKLAQTFAKSFFALSAAASIVGMALNLAGIGGPSEDDLLLEAIQTGFQRMDEKLNELQRFIRDEVLEAKLLVGDVALDDLTSGLEVIGRSFTDYVNATAENRAAIYGPRLRAVCNEPFKTPYDIFYGLYGYVCKTCDFGSRKRADLLQLAVDKSANEPGGASAVTFMGIFGNFTLRAMSTAMFYHGVCLPPIEGACVDRPTDLVWLERIGQMNISFLEAGDNIRNISETLTGQWVETLRADDLKPLVEGSTESIANGIVAFFREKQPSFRFQVLVAKRDNELKIEYLSRAGCGKTETERCSTVLDRTGHFWFDDINGHTISIRYRDATLAPPNANIALPGQEPRPFAEFYRTFVEEKYGIIDLNSAPFKGPPLPCFPPFEVNGLTETPTAWAACLVSTCVLCNEAENAAFQAVVSSTNNFVHRLKDDGATFSELFVGYTSTSEAENNQYFPRVDVRFLKAANIDDPFRFYFT